MIPKDFKAGKWLIQNGGPWFEGRPCSTALDAIIDAVKARVLFNYLALPFSL
jgi:hypothetical protein